MWNRMFGADSFRAKGTSYIRSTLHQVLDQTECSQLVIGHSVQVLLLLFDGPEMMRAF